MEIFIITRSLVKPIWKQQPFSNTSTKQHFTFIFHILLLLVALEYLTVKRITIVGTSKNYVNLMSGGAPIPLLIWEWRVIVVSIVLSLWIYCTYVLSIFFKNRKKNTHYSMISDYIPGLPGEHVISLIIRFVLISNVTVGYYDVMSLFVLALLAIILLSLDQRILQPTGDGSFGFACQINDLLWSSSVTLIKWPNYILYYSIY